MTDLFVGQRVVCIKDCHDHHGYGDEDFPVVGEIYHVRDVVVLPDDERLCLLLREIKNPVRQYFLVRDYYPIEPPWLLEYFKPLEAKSMEVFRKIAKNVKVGEDA